MESGKISTVLSSLANLIEKEKQGIVCATIMKIGEARIGQVSKWKYRELSVKDESMESTLQIGDDRFLALKLKVGDQILFHVKSRGLDNEGRLTVMFQKESNAQEAAALVASLLEELNSSKLSKKNIKRGPTVWPFGSREARGLIRLVKYYLEERKPQHYHKFSLDQFVAQDLLGGGWVKRVGKGLYIPTDEALSKVRANTQFPSSRIKLISQTGVSFQDSPNATYKTIVEFLDSETDADTAKEEFKETMRAIEGA